MKYIFVTGGVVSSLGKGLTAASLGALLELRGLKVRIQKFDPYLNVDPGTMSPFQHGEVYVLEDGAETDLDLGHYERFTSGKLSRLNSLSSGQIYESVIQKERRGDYLGKTVQVIPHVTNEIKDRIYSAAKDVDVLITEIGGTTGDIEGLPFLEAMRQFALEVGPNDVIFIHVTLVPYVAAAVRAGSAPWRFTVQLPLKSISTRGDNPNAAACSSRPASCSAAGNRVRSMMPGQRANASVAGRPGRTAVASVDAWVTTACRPSPATSATGRPARAGSQRSSAGRGNPGTVRTAKFIRRARWP